MPGMYQRHAAAEAAPMQDETIIFQSERNQFCVLNHTAAVLWEALAAPRSADDLAKALTAAYVDADPARVQDDVRRTVEELEALALVVPVA